MLRYRFESIPTSCIHQRSGGDFHAEPQKTWIMFRFASARAELIQFKRGAEPLSSATEQAARYSSIIAGLQKGVERRIGWWGKKGDVQKGI